MTNKMPQDSARSYKILKDPTGFYGILHKNALRSISIANKILQDPARFYGIREKNAMESITIEGKILQDSTGYLTKMLWNPYQ